MSSAETNKHLVRHVIEEATRGNLDILQAHPGLHETIPMQRALHEGFSEAKVTFALQFSEGEWVASRIIDRRKHTGTFMGHPPTNRQIEIEVLLFHRVVDGQIVQQHAQADVMASMQQMGGMPGGGSDAAG